MGANILNFLYRVNISASYQNFRRSSEMIFLLFMVFLLQQATDIGRGLEERELREGKLRRFTRALEPMTRSFKLLSRSSVFSLFRPLRR